MDIKVGKKPAFLGAFVCKIEAIVVPICGFRFTYLPLTRVSSFAFVVTVPLKTLNKRGQEERKSFNVLLHENCSRLRTFTS
jgi:hypothetical protein